MRIVVRPVYPFRIEMELGATYQGPFVSTTLGLFDPRRDLRIFVAGDLLKTISYTYDLANNRYLIYSEQPFDTDSRIDVIYHMPAPPFTEVGDPTAILRAFCKTAEVETNIDENGVDPILLNFDATDLTPLTTDTVILYYNCINVPVIKITSDHGYDSGFISCLVPFNTGSLVIEGFGGAGVYEYTIQAFDADNNPLLDGIDPIILTLNLTVS